MMNEKDRERMEKVLEVVGIVCEMTDADAEKENAIMGMANTVYALGAMSVKQA